MTQELIERLKSDFKKLVEIADNEGFYLDINYFSKEEVSINKDLVNTDISKDNDKGIKIRIWDNEKYLEFGTSSLDYIELEKIVKDLIEKAKNNQAEISEKVNLKVDEKIVEKDFINENLQMKLQDKDKKLDEVKNDSKKLDEDIVNVRTLLIEEYEQHLFVNKYKCLFQQIPLKIFVLVLFVKCADESTRTVYKCFTNNNFDVFKKYDDSILEIKEKILSVKKAKKLDGGKYKVVLSPTLTGLLAHESFGHGMEADTMMRDRALATGLIGEKIGEKDINIVDYPQIEGKNGEFYFDHEGNLAVKTYLVKDGIINEPMSDLYSKTRLDLDRSSNSRFESFDHKHYTRMSNTYFETGDKSYKDLIKEVEEGIFITRANGGMEDPKGWGVQIQGCFGERIKNGKLTGEFYDGFSFTGFLPDIVKNIKGLSKEFEMDGAGSCGKGHKEWVRVAEGGPYMLIEEVTLG